VMTTTEDTGVVASAVDNRMRRSSLYNRIQGKTHAGERKVYFKSCRGEVNMEEKNDEEPAACTGFNSFAFRIPIYNLFHPVVSTQNEQPGWPQISEMLMNISLGSALALALVCGFYCGVDYAEIQSAEIRFSQGSPELGILTTPWDYAFDESMTNGSLTTSFVPKVVGSNKYPCFNPRQIDPEGTIAPGSYAEWYWSPEYMGFKDSVVENFNWAVASSTMVMTAALLLSTVVSATGAANIFARSSSLTHSFQYRKILQSYQFWVRWVLITIVVLYLVGLWLFIQTFAYMVYIKYSDTWLSEGIYIADKPGWIDQWFYNASSVYNYTSTATLWVLYFWIFIGTMLVSKGQHAAYTFPVRPISDVSIQAKGLKARTEMYKETGGDKESLLTYLKDCLPNAPSLNVGPHGYGGACKEDKKSLDGIYLSVAGGIPAAEAEVVCDALFDHGIYTVTDLLNLIDLKDNALFELPGVQLGAAMVVTMKANADLNALGGGKPDESGAGDDASDEETEHFKKHGVIGLRTISRRSMKKRTSVSTNVGKGAAGEAGAAY